MALCLLVGVVAMLLWRTQRVRPVGARRGRRDVFYLYAGLTALSWAFYLANNSIQFVPLSWPWWGALVFLARAGFLYSMLALSRHVARAKHTDALPSWLRWPVRWMILCSLLALLGAWLSQDWRILVAWYFFETAWLLLQGVHYLYQAFLRKGSMSQRWVCIMLVAGVLAAAHDWCQTWLWQDPSAAYALQFSALFQAAVLSWLVIARFNAVSHQGQRLLETLSHRLSARECKLHDSYQQLTIVQREQARMLERTRIMRDMHDGVGLHLVLAIRQLDDEHNSRLQVAQTLRDAMDQLKLSIDVMSLSSGDVTGLLSSLRFRLAPRLESAGLTLHWQVSELPPVENMDTEQLGQLQYIVFEAISNVLQHANASALRVSAFDEGGELVVEIEDDGKGISAGEAEDQDAGSMQMRAAERGWCLTVQPVGNTGRGTRVRLSIPR